MKHKLFAGAFSALMALGTAQTAMAEPVYCTGSLSGAVVEGDLIVPSGQSCQLDNVEIGSNLVVESNARLEALSIFIGGGFSAQASADIHFVNSLVGSGMDVIDLGSVNDECKDKADGEKDKHKDKDCHKSVHKSEAGHCLIISGSYIGNDLLVDSLQARRPFDKDLDIDPTSEAPCLDIFNNVVGGNILVTRSSDRSDEHFDGAGPFVIEANLMGSNLLFQSNAITSRIDGNQVTEHLQFLCNTEAGQIVRNTIFGDLNYQSSEPVPLVEGNLVFRDTNLVNCN